MAELRALPATFLWSDWESKRVLDELVWRGASTAEMVKRCQAALTRATRARQESERIYLSDRLAELLIELGRFGAARKTFERLWPGTITPALFGLRYLTFLLRVKDHKAASRTVLEMRARLREETPRHGAAEPPHFEQLAVLTAEAVLLLALERLGVRRYERRRLKILVDRISSLASHLPWVPFVHTELLGALAQAHEYELARQFLDFIVLVRPLRPGLHPPLKRAGGPQSR